jgi:CBS domain containing-hemolysin-like protein
VGGRDAETIRHLVEYSTQAGVFEPALRSQISEVIALQTLTAGGMVASDVVPTSVSVDATVADVRAVAQMSGHLRILLMDAAGTVSSVVHVRDTLLAADDAPAVSFARPAFRVSESVPVYEVLRQMREQRVQLAIVEQGDSLVGVLTLTDVIKRVLPGRAAAAA